MAKSTEETKSEATYTPVDLFGEFRFKVDSKGRVALPAKFRKDLSSDLVVSLEPTDDCLYVFEAPAFNQWIDRLFEDSFGGFDAADKSQVLLRRKLKARADMVSTDSSGRIMLKPELRSEAGISKEVVLVGNTGYFEIWDADAYDATNSEIDLSALYKKHE